jgi:hypothetical protein
MRLQIRDGSHALGGEHAAAFQLPMLVLLQQNGSDQVSDRGAIGEDARADSKSVTGGLAGAVSMG